MSATKASRTFVEGMEYWLKYGVSLYFVIQSTLKTNNGGQNVNEINYPEIMRFCVCGRSSHDSHKREI